MRKTYHLERTDLQDDMNRIFGAGYWISDIQSMNGGAQKVVYRVECTNGFTCMLYVWDIDMNYFQQEIEEELVDKSSYGSELFEWNTIYLTEQRVRTPAIYYLNKMKDRYPYDYALVEYIQGKDLSCYIDKDSNQRHKVLEELGSMLSRMHRLERQVYGDLNVSENRLEQCHLLELENGKRQLAYLANHSEAMANDQDKLLNKLYELESNIKPRHHYSFIHGELGPNHVIVNEKLETYLIDIEGAMYYDLEHEHSNLQFRFGEAYSYLKKDNLDHDRMLFYKLQHHISYASGGLKLLHRGFPNQQLANGIFSYNYRNALAFIE